MRIYNLIRCNSLVCSAFAAIVLLLTPATLAAQETGVAVYYSDYFQGKPVASGETFDQQKMTAAHNGSPYGTEVRVTNLANDKSVVVRINDRMRSNSKVLIDVTKRAAEELGFVREGTAQVRVERVE